MALRSLTPEQELRVKQLIEEAHKTTGIIDLFQRVLPKNSLLPWVCLLGFLSYKMFGELDDAYHYYEDAKDILPTAVHDAEYLGSYALARLEEGFDLPGSPDGAGHYAVPYSAGTNGIVINLPNGTSAGSITGLGEDWYYDENGELKMMGAKNLLA